MKSPFTENVPNGLNKGNIDVFNNCAKNMWELTKLAVTITKEVIIIGRNQHFTPVYWIFKRPH